MSKNGAKDRSEHSTETLVDAARRGDRHAFGVLVRRFENVAFAAALSVINERSDAEDAVQEGFILAWIRLDQLRNTCRFGPWLRSIVQSRALDSVRRKTSAPFVSEHVDTAAVGMSESSRDTHERNRQRLEVREAIDLLPEKYREVVNASLTTNYTYARLANYLGLSETTVKGRLQQARQKLRKTLSDDTMKGNTVTQRSKKHSVADEVDRQIVKISRMDVAERVPLGDTKRIVLFCGVPTTVEVCQNAGPDAQITGTITSLGYDEEDAQRSVRTIKLYHDQVESYLESGPHPGEIFNGTTLPEGKPIAIVRAIGGPSQKRSAEDREHFPFRGSSIFPDIRTDAGKAIERLESAFGRATRITLIREKAEDITLPKISLNETIIREFRGNYDDEDVVHGPRGLAHLVLAVPVDTDVVLQGSSADIQGLRGNVVVMNQDGTSINAVHGDVLLVNTKLSHASGIHGRLTCMNYDRYGGVSLRENRMGLLKNGQMSVENIHGPVDIDVAVADIDMRGLHGNVSVRNRWGNTYLHVDEYTEPDRYHLRSTSGDIRVTVREELLDRIAVSAHSICGEIDFSAVQRPDDEKAVGNDTQTMVYCTRPTNLFLPAKINAEVTITNEAGRTVIETTE